MPETIFAFRTKEEGLDSLYWVLNAFVYYNKLKTKLIDVKKGEFIASAEGKELNEALEEVKRQAKSFRIVKGRS